MEKVKQIVKMGDFFNSFQMLRFEKETEYRTFTGGLISVGIIITIIIAFASMIIDTVNRTTISFTFNEERSGDPSLSVITVSPENNFMFAVSVEGYNLSSEYRLFDVVFEQIESTFGVNYTYTPYPLEACTKQHWASLPEVYNNFQQHNAGLWLCPPIGTIIQLEGKFTSEVYHQYSVTVYPCSNSTDPDRPCGTPEQLNQFFQENGQWNYFTYFYINSIVNAAQPQYKSYYLEDRNYIVFGPKMGAELDMYLNEIDITSDNSIWPFQDIANDVAYYVNFGPILYPFAVDNTTSFATFYMMKDPADQTYVRAVQKIFVVFSFMGGLIGAILACLFIVNTYTSFAFQLALAIEVFTTKQTATTQAKLYSESIVSLNLFHFLKYFAYSTIKRFKSNLNWPFYEYIQECRNQILEQLDIKNLIKRIIFLEYSISFILEDYQLAEMQQEKPNLPQEIKKLRKKIQSQNRIKDDELDSIDSNKECIHEMDKMEKSEVSSISEKSALQSNLRLSIQIDHKKLNNIHLEDKIQNNDTLDIKGVANTLVYNQNVIVQRKKLQNIKKLKDSAKRGNLVSKKLLEIISLEKNRDSIYSSDSKKRQQWT